MPDMVQQRSIDRVVTIPPLEMGFGGPQHRAAFAIQQGDFARTDPFFLLAEDHFLADGPIGAAHPHAGIETVTFKLKGTGGADNLQIHEGDVEWLTAGNGVTHGENAHASAGMFGLQLWIVLPESARALPPHVQIIRRDDVPVRRLPGVEVRVYSGKSGDVVSSTRNATDVSLTDIRLERDATVEQEVPIADNGFLLVLEGEVVAGKSGERIAKRQMGWLDRPKGTGESMLTIRGASLSTRVLLYTGAPRRMSPIAQGPFVAGSEPELFKFYENYRKGQFPRVATLGTEIHE